MRFAGWTIATALCLFLSCVTDAGAARLRGTFALQHGSLQTAGYLDVTPTAPLVDRLSFSLVPIGSDRPVTRYDVDMTKLMHVVIVGDGLRTFMHVHPVLAPDGRLTIEQRFPHPGLYYVYADAVPHGFGQQVFRFDLPVGDVSPPTHSKMPSLPRTGPTVVSGPYTVTLSRTTLRAGGESRVNVRVEKNGKLASDMQTYLGAAAHAVFLNERDLTYVHVHPLPSGSHDDEMDMSMDGMAMGSMSSAASPAMTLHVAVDEPGTYAFWLQFRAGGSLHVAPFVVVAR